MEILQTKITPRDLYFCKEQEVQCPVLPKGDRTFVPIIPNLIKNKYIFHNFNCN